MTEKKFLQRIETCKFGGNKNILKSNIYYSRLK